MQIQSSSTSFSTGQAGSMATGMPFAPYGSFASGGQGLAQTATASAYGLGRQDGAASALQGAAYLQGRQDGAVTAAAPGNSPRIYSPESTAAAGDNPDGAGGAGGNCPNGKCSSGGGGDIGQVLSQLLQALAPMMQAVAPIAGMMGGLGGGKAA